MVFAFMRLFKVEGKYNHLALRLRDTAGVGLLVAVGNAVQAVIFGLMHGIMFFSMVGVMKAVLITLFTGIIAWLMGFANEKRADGSILPSWCIHSISNIFSGLCAAFSMF